MNNNIQTLGKMEINKIKLKKLIIKANFTQAISGFGEAKGWKNVLDDLNKMEKL